jgi:cation transport ATPase
MHVRPPPAVLDQNVSPPHDHHGHDHDDDQEGDDHSHSFDWAEAIRIAIVALAAVAVWFKLWEPFTAVSVVGIAGLLVGGWPILKEAFENVLERRMTMELSMTIAIVAAAAIGQFFTALIITLFVLVAERRPDDNASAIPGLSGGFIWPLNILLAHATIPEPPSALPN